MNPKEIINQCSENGLTLTITEDGNLDVVGSQDWIDIWSSILRENKSAILAELTGNATPSASATPSMGAHEPCNVSVTFPVTQQPLNECLTDDEQKPINNALATDNLQAPYKPLTSPSETFPVTPDANALQAHSDGKYSINCTDASADPVLVELTIAGQTSFTLQIPQKYYDGLALLELLEQHNAQAETQSVMPGLLQQTEGIDSRRAA